MDVNYIEIGRRTRHIREEKGITQRRLADLIDMSATHVSHIEQGTTKLGLPTIVAIANALGTTVDTLMRDSLVRSENEYLGELSKLLEECSPVEVKFIYEVSSSALESLRRAKSSYDKMTKEQRLMLSFYLSIIENDDDRNTLDMSTDITTG